MTLDRRRNRTTDKSEAMRRFLGSCVLRLGLRSLTLGGKDGLLLASAGDGVDPESAAAFAPFIFHERWAYPEKVDAPYFVDAIPYPLGTLYLFAVGARSDRSLRSSGTKAGIRRILDE